MAAPQSRALKSARRGPMVLANADRESHLTMNFSRVAARARARVRWSVRRRRPERRPPQKPAAATVAASQRGVMNHAEVRTIFFGLMLAAFLAALNQTIIATALP